MGNAAIDKQLTITQKVFAFVLFQEKQGAGVQGFLGHVFVLAVKW